jgi:hypothetical protein
MKKSKVSNNPLLAAMQLLSLCQDKDGTEMHCYCNIENNRAVAFDGVVAAGSTIIEDFDACPHTLKLAAALASCGDTFAITQLSQESILVRSGDFQAFVPCCEREKLPQAAPDAAIVAITPALLDSLKIVAPLASDKAAMVIAGSVLISQGSALATNRVVILEAWHGCDLPVMLLPKQAVKALLDSGRIPVRFGYSGKTATFWFDDYSWIRTQLYQDGAKDLQSYLNQPNIERRKMPQEFFTAVKKIAPFSQTGEVYCRQGSISSHYRSDQQGSQLSIEIENGPVDVAYSIKELKYLEKFAEEFDEHFEKFTLFFGSKARGAIWHTKIAKPVICKHGINELDCDDCIPF